MKTNCIVLIAIFIVFQVNNKTECSFTNFDVKKFVGCNNTQLQLKYYGHITKEKNKYYLTHNITLPYPVAENLALNFNIQVQTVGNVFTELFTIRERNFCKALNKYLGEFWYDIERQSQITPGLCPIQMGRYHGNHILLHFEKITLQTFPFGTLRFIVSAIDNRKKNIVWCQLIEVENTVN